MRLKLLVLVPAALILHLSSASATICGDTSFNHDINWAWTSDLYYTIVGSPANTCGDLWADRGNGWQLEAVGWACTNSLGQAIKGPWSHSNQATDEIANVLIDWGTCTSDVEDHIWDVNPPTVVITSNPPSAFSGTATDAAAGFSASWAACWASFYDATSSKYWDSATDAYTSSSYKEYACGIFGMPTRNTTWSATQRPGSGAGSHTSGHQYYWTVWVYDGGLWDSDQDSFVF